MAKHTPGPWKINGVSLPGRYQIDDAKNGPVAITDARYDLHTGYEQADANARLIAAAPELLAALKLFVEGFDPDKEYEGVYAIFEDKARIAAAAIAKAEGALEPA